MSESEDERPIRRKSPVKSSKKEEKEEDKKKPKYAGRGVHRSSEDVPDDRHWKRAHPLESMDKEELKPRTPSSDEKSKKKDKKKSGDSQLTYDQEKMLKK